ncbi:MULTISPECIES: NOP5/NOP56 family protein [Halobacterium]|uniref:Archaeal nucleolar protein homolog n=5 Tax=Halobacterium salinarum TaxID=2242 RepID=Q9HQG4_HALSA|nr:MULTISPECIES: NOP5/NOP56 family protein [Halobacterium]AAG19551.1 archaeal nucleolar protein homolog [Halobacterium salinarum NRC-1]MBB6090238.1 nucleolar protein 56 [Halobacterium salinarum]MCF2165061.1 NOP58 family protein [Halobacterium salinarum]MCF2168602.1 NOP58 family protein [Halobacterium salinarum]MCF2238244.1 NOP58 family protein [Halobacterium salinarum]
MTTHGWFADTAVRDADAAADAVRNGHADAPENWPAAAVEDGVVDDADEYYDRLRDATRAATRAAVRERERADDQQLVHAVRTIGDLSDAANEVAERAVEWARTLFDGVDDGIAGARDVAGRSANSPTEERAIALCERATDLADERDRAQGFVETHAPTVAPNLSMLAGPVLAARLIALAGGLDDLAKLPSGTVQVLGAEDALFAHLRGHAPSPKHGVIYTHEYVRGTHPDQRGSAARALAGKLTIAARVDHYSGDRRPDLEAELDARMERIRARETE